MHIPLIIGLPGAGKSETTKILSGLIGIGIISTDDKFRELRSIPVNNNRSDAEVMRLFLSQVEKDFLVTGKLSQTEYDRLYQACLPDKTDSKLRTSFRDSTLARSFGGAEIGEKVFRTFEWIMNQWLHENDHFKDKIVDISSSAAMYPQNLAIFNKVNGYVPILLDAEHDVILDRLVHGFRLHQKLSHEKGEWVPVRGAYDKVARDAAVKSGEDSDEVIRPALSDYALKARAERLEFYREMAEYTIKMPEQQDDEKIARQIYQYLQGMQP